MELLIMDVDLFGERLRKIRTERNLNQDDLAALSGVAQATISEYESGKRRAAPRSDQVAKLATVLGVTADYLLGLVDIPNANLTGEVSTSSLKPQKEIPILGKVAAGSGVPAEEDIVGYASVDQADAADFALTVTGFSMFPKLLDGDVVFVRKQPVARNGQMVVVRINGQEGVIKYFQKRSDMVILTSENPEYKPIRIDKDRWDAECAIIGVVVGLKRKFSDS
ncbi:LexA family protein [Mesotoga sp. UBA5847]|uniref:LexA family protein n=1 Tax=Mesotoga sp. UBA5847 TaxID=1946859 RepID=UPI0025E0A5FD|nr:LexA family transcriptional regulator [Mesotoga sp. UBA5847]